MAEDLKAPDKKDDKGKPPAKGGKDRRWAGIAIGIGIAGVVVTVLAKGSGSSTASGGTSAVPANTTTAQNAVDSSLSDQLNNQSAAISQIQTSLASLSTGTTQVSGTSTGNTWKGKSHQKTKTTGTTTTATPDVTPGLSSLASELEATVGGFYTAPGQPYLVQSSASSTGTQGLFYDIQNASQIPAGSTPSTLFWQPTPGNFASASTAPAGTALFYKVQ